MRNYRPKQVELIEIINKPLLLHLVGYLYYWQMEFNSVFKGLKGVIPREITLFNIQWNAFQVPNILNKIFKVRINFWKIKVRLSKGLKQFTYGRNNNNNYYYYYYYYY